MRANRSRSESLEVLTVGVACGVARQETEDEEQDKETNHNENCNLEGNHIKLLRKYFR